jgi:hypothetical protein
VSVHVLLFPRCLQSPSNTLPGRLDSSPSLSGSYRLHLGGLAGRLDYTSPSFSFSPSSASSRPVHACAASVSTNSAFCLLFSGAPLLLRTVGGRRSQNRDPGMMDHQIHRHAHLSLFPCSILPLSPRALFMRCSRPRSTTRSIARW